MKLLFGLDAVSGISSHLTFSSMIYQSPKGTAIQ